MVQKPAEWSPFTAHLLAEIALEAGLPPGVLNVVHGLGETAGKALTEHPSIKAIAFVGESSTGSAIQAQGAPTLKRVHFELGGKNPVIVFDDADLERAADAAVFMIYSLNGERCTSSSRLLVQDSIYDDFTATVAQKMKNIPVGHPLDPSSVIGPLIHPRHLAKVTSYREIAVEDGATVIDGTPWADAPDGGNWVSPMLFTGGRTEMRIAQEEIFGPVVSIIGYDSVEQAIEIANDTEYGLAGYISGDQDEAVAVAKRIRTGMMHVNGAGPDFNAPFGGYKQSGNGREWGELGFEEFLESKAILGARA